MLLPKRSDGVEVGEGPAEAATIRSLPEVVLVLAAQLGNALQDRVLPGMMRDAAEGRFVPNVDP